MAEGRDSWNRGDWARVIRLFTMGATVVYAPLGMATVPGGLGAASVVWAVLVGVSFHLFAFPLNDVVDFPIDRTNTRRLDSPLVRGLVRRRWLLYGALLQLPVMIVLLALGEVASAGVAAWAIAVAGLALYDLFGKRISVPFVADSIQGVGFAALVLMGAYWRGSPTALSWVVAAYVGVYIVQINAVHGGVRDIANDASHGAFTTPILLGCTVTSDGTPVVSRSLVVLTVVFEATMLALLLAAAVAAFEGAAWWLMAPTAMAMRMLAVSLGWRAYQAIGDRPRMMSLGSWHLFWSLTAIVVVPLGSPVWLAVVVLVVYLTPPAASARLTN